MRSDERRTPLASCSHKGTWQVPDLALPEIDMQVGDIANLALDQENHRSCHRAADATDQCLAP